MAASGAITHMKTHSYSCQHISFLVPSYVVGTIQGEIFSSLPVCLSSTAAAAAIDVVDTWNADTLYSYIFRSGILFLYLPSLSLSLLLLHLPFLTS